MGKKIKQHEIIHFLYCPFTGLGLFNGYRGDKWLKNRINIFKQYTLPSILNQTNKNFVLWISWRPEEVNNPIVDEFGEMLESIRDLTVFFTYGGVMFWDDKYENDNLLERLQRTLPHVAEGMNTLPYSDKVLMTIQPSDDMYIDTAVEQIQDTYFRTPDATHMALGWQQGYIMNYATKEIAYYNTHGIKTDHISTYDLSTIPPFFTIAFPRDVFTDPDKHYKHIGPYHSHEEIGSVMPYKTIEGRGFCVGTHGANISTTFNHRYKGKTQAQDLLYQFGVYYSDPIKISKTWRLYGRKALNVVPFNQVIRRIYKSLPIKYQIL